MFPSQLRCNAENWSQYRKLSSTTYNSDVSLFQTSRNLAFNRGIALFSLSESAMVIVRQEDAGAGAQSVTRDDS